MNMQQKRLVRAKDGRMIAGVCKGFADYFGIDPTLVRIGFVLTLLPGGVPGLLLYGILWLIMPSE
jgi:phage shock protein C